jgi:hypothetical protein
VFYPFGHYIIDIQWDTQKNLFLLVAGTDHTGLFLRPVTAFHEMYPFRPAFNMADQLPGFFFGTPDEIFKFKLHVG